MPRRKPVDVLMVASGEDRQAYPERNAVLTRGVIGSRGAAVRERLRGT